MDYENRGLFEEQFELVHLCHLDSLAKEAIDDITLLRRALDRRAHRFSSDRKQSIERRIQFQQEMIDRIKYELIHYTDETLDQFDYLMMIKQ